MNYNPFYPLKPNSSPAPSGPLDPEVVYRQTRPADWLKMPEVANAPGNLYALVLIPQGATVCFPLLISGAAVRIEYGYTDSTGTFICTSVASQAATGSFAGLIDSSYFGHLTSDGHVQCMVRVSYESGQPYIIFQRPSGDSSYAWVSPIREISCNVCSISLGGFTTALKLLKYFSGYGFPPAYFMFTGISSLIALRHLDTNQFQDAYSFFEGCSSLIAIPHLNTTNIYDFSDMFKDCTSLEYVPDMDISNAWSLAGLFEGCISLKELPDMNTSGVQDFRSLIKNCIAIKSFTGFDTSRGTDFDEMFSGCISLREVEVDTSNALSLKDMFKSCHALEAVPALHTERIHDVDLFNDSGITALADLPVSDKTTTLSFEDMHALCRISLFVNGWEGCDVSFEGTFLSREAYIEFFQSLPVITGEYIITLGSVLGGANALTAEDRAIATNKGWIIQ